jgi:VanZ family protein
MPSPSPANRYWSTRTLGYVFLATWLAIMAATMWPFNPVPRNDVSWLPDANGLHFGRNGILTSSTPFLATPASENHPCSLEILVRPESDTSVRTFFSFYVASGQPLGFQLRQYGQILLVAHAVPAPRGHFWNPEIDVEHVFQRGKWTLITVVSGKRGTTVYLDGELAIWVPGYHLPLKSLSGELLLGAEPVVYDPWSGDISAFALYGEELSAPTVREHFAQSSMAATRPFVPQDALAAYVFNEHNGSVVHNVAVLGQSLDRTAPAAPPRDDHVGFGNAPDLLIPAHFYVPHQAFLTPPWEEFSPRWTYADDLLRNILGFFPFGVAAYLYLLRRLGPRHAILFTVLVGFTTSLSIEILQAFIPQRSSGITDIITNTTGAALGAFILQARPIRVMLASLGILAMEPAAIREAEHD